MKIFIILITLIFISHCSFDNKSGIWQNNNDAISTKNSQFKSLNHFHMLTTHLIK